MIHLLRQRSFLFSICFLAFLATACLQDPERPQNVPKAPTVSIDQAFLTRTSMTLAGSFDAGATLFGWGFEMTEGSFTNGVITKIENPRRLESGTFEYVVPVKQGTHYSVRSYISNGRQNLYSEEVSVITPNSSVPTLSDVVLNGRTVSARILDDGGRKINEAGFYWGETPQDVRKNKVVVPVIDSTISYSIDPTELENKSYYFQGYAENSDGEGEMYGFSHNLLEVRINEEFPVGIRDEEFNRYLLNFYDKDGNEILTFRELGAVTRIELNTDNIYSLKEIRFMPMLETLICMGSDVQSGGLVELDVSKNGRLTTLKCDNNKIESLDLSNNTQLAFLSCSGNMLSRLDVSTCPELKELLSTDCPTLKEICIFPGQDVSGFLLDHTVVFSMPNTISIPISDINFKQYLLSQFDADQDGALSGIEASRIEQIQVNTDHIKSIEEIRFFPNLKSLFCTGSWDSSRNTAIGQLESIDVSKNMSLTSLACNYNQLKALDVSNNVFLRHLSCDHNQLMDLDVSNNTSLMILYCYTNQLTNLNVTNNASLERLECDHNQLTSLDVSNNTSLTYLSCGSNQLKKLNVSNNTMLTRLECYGTQLTSLDVSNNTSLMTLSCSNNQLTNLDVSNNVSLTELFCSNNQLTSLDVSKNTSLEYLYCYNNQLTSLDVSGNTMLRELWCTGNSIKFVIVWEDFDRQQMTLYRIGDAITYEQNNDDTEIRIADNSFKDYLTDSFDGNGDGKLSETEAKFIERIEIDTDIIKSIEEIQCFPNLKSLFCAGRWDGFNLIAMGQLTNLDVSNNTLLTILVCYNNQLTSLDISKNTSLTSLWCSGNQLMSLDVSNNESLTELSCYNNQLTSLDVSKNTSLMGMHCGGNQLLNLDVSENTLLKELFCGNNLLTSLDVSKNTSLTSLGCSGNQLTSLDVSNNLLLTSLSCGYNPLKDLDISKNTSLTRLDCEGNQLTSLDVSNNLLLTSLSCGNNLLTSLDVSNNQALSELNCINNPFLTEIWLKTGQTITNFSYDIDRVIIRYKD